MKIEDIESLEPKPGDVLVVTVENMRPETAKRLRDELGSVFKERGVEVLVVEKGQAEVSLQKVADGVVSRREVLDRSS